MGTINAVKRKARIFLSNERKKKDSLTVIALLFLGGVFAYSFLYTHLELGYNQENMLSIFKEGQGLTGFAEREETTERAAASSEEDTSTSSLEETAAPETVSEPTSRTIARQTTATASSSTRTVSRTPAADSPASSPAPATIPRKPSASIDSSISRMVSPITIERKTTAATAEGEITARIPIKPAIVRTAVTPLQSFDSISTETIQRKSAVVVQRTAPSLTKALITISRKPVTDLGEEAVQKVEEAVKKNEENPELPAVKQVLEISPEEKKVTLVLATNPGAETIAPKMSVAVNKLPTEKYKPRLNQPWNPLGLFNALAYGKKTVKTQSFSTGKDQSIIAQQLDISFLEEGEYEVFTQLTDRGNILSSDRTGFSSKGKE